MKRFGLSISVLTALLLYSPAAVTSPSGDIHGTVKDAKTGEALPSANIVIVGTSLGAATDFDGNYVIRSVPPG